LLKLPGRLKPLHRCNNCPKYAFADSLPQLLFDPPSVAQSEAATGTVLVQCNRGLESAKADFGPLLQRIPFARPRPDPSLTAPAEGAAGPGG